MSHTSFIREFEIAMKMNPDADPVNILIGMIGEYDIKHKEFAVVPFNNINERALKRYIAVKRVENKSEKTCARYADELQKLLDGLNLPITEITADHIRYWLGMKNVKPSTLEGVRRIYSAFFKWLFNEKIIANDPCTTLGSIKIPKVQKKAFLNTELDRIRRACTNLRDLAIVDFLNATGCRVGELVNVKIKDLDIIDKSLTVVGKGKKERTVYLDDIALMNIQKYLHSRDDDCEYLFTGKGGVQIHENGVRAIFKRLEKKSGVENIHPHRFRRTLTTRLLNRGMRIEEVAEILGHEDITTTRKYCEIVNQNVKNSYARYCA